MENTHKRTVGRVLRLGLSAIRDARYTNCGNVVIYTDRAPDKSTKISVTNTLRGKTGRITWKSSRIGHRVFSTSRYLS